MKRIFGLLSLAMSLSFAELQIVETPVEGRSGFFVGLGIGIGANALTFSNATLPSTNIFVAQKQSFASFVSSLKVGGYYYFTPIIGLRYYYNFDLNVTPFGSYTLTKAEEGPLIANEAIYASSLSASYTLNLDAIYTVFTQDKWSVDVLGGIGFGTIIGNITTKQKTVYAPQSYYLNGDFRFNLGVRAMFERKYGVEFMAKLPVISTIIYQAQQAPNLKTTITQSPFYFTIDFVVEKF